MGMISKEGVLEGSGKRQESQDEMVNMFLGFDQQDYKNLKKSFDTFLDQEINPLWDNYILQKDNVVVQVFSFNPMDHKEDSVELFLAHGRTNKELHTISFPLAVVLAAGENAVYLKDGKEVRYQKGDVIKLKDKDSRVVKNPTYEQWISTDYEDSNMKKVGKEPPAKISNLHRSFGKYRCKVNPFDSVFNREDMFTFDLPSMYVEGVILEPKAFLK